MQRYLSYVGMFIGVVLLQIFLIDNISLGIYFHPLIYVAFVILLPLGMQPVWVVLLLREKERRKQCVFYRR